MTVIPDERMLNRLLVELKCEFSEIDLMRVAEVLPTAVLAAELYSRNGASFVRADTPEKKIQLLIRVSLIWQRFSQLRLGQLFNEALWASGLRTPLNLIEDGELIGAIEALPQGGLAPPE